MNPQAVGQGAAHDALEGKVALVTGASKRIGRALSIALAEEGVHIVAHDRKNLEADTIRVCGEVKDCGANSWPVMADLEKPEEYETLVRRALQAAGSLDILINNASIFLPGTIMDIGFGDVMRHMHVNAWTPLVLSREFARLARRGTIVNILDTKIAGFDREHAAYILSKHMLSVVTRLCAVEFAPEITVNGIAPGLILPPNGKDETYLDEKAKSLPLKRHGGPEDVTEAALYLLRSRFVTGQVIYVDGGRHLLEADNGPNPD
ncbi:MAG TPA: SDR family oxidoreductase [Nitrospirota bacterium]|nr:SDR family oxidoreductase [Nitrospirota bacterium]